MSRAMSPDSAPKPENGLDRMTTVELKLIADRQRDAERKRKARQREAEERQQAAERAPATIATPMPQRLKEMKPWLVGRHDAYERGEITSARLAEARRTVSTVGELYRTEAMIRSAEAQEKIAERLIELQYGTMALAILQQGLASGKRKPLPGRRLAIEAAPTP